MRENLSDTVRQVLDRAQIEARNLNQEFVSTEHLLLAILHFGHSEAARVLATGGVNLDEARSAITHHLPKLEQAPIVVGALPLSPKAQRIINGAISRTQALRQRKVCSRLVMLSLLEEPQSALRQALSSAGVDFDQLQRRLMERQDPPED